MKKPSKGSTPSKAKAPVKKGKSQVNPILDILNNMDDDLIATIKQTVLNEIEITPDLLEPEDTVDLFAEYLELCEQENADEDDKNELLADLVSELSELQVDSNGGDPEARESVQAIYDLLDDAIEQQSISPIDMMIIGKIFSDAAWAVPDSLKQALAQALQIGSLANERGAPIGPAGSLVELPDEIGKNPFDAHDYLNSILAALPSDVSMTLLHEFIAARKPIINQAIAGFILHPDIDIAIAVAEALSASAKSSPVESASIERLVRMRPWLPQVRQTYLDATIRVMRLNGLSPIKVEPVKIIKCYASVCDGS
ncbi:MAG TPA: hypothetical protein VIJ25_17560, partial [Methylococcales bacterium]